MSVISTRLGASLLSGAALLLASVVAQAPALAGEESGAEVGVLTCNTVPGSRLNLLIHSTADIECDFKDSDGSVEHQSTDDSGCRGRFDLLQPMTESTESCAHFVSAVPFKTPMQTGPQIKVIDFGMATLWRGCFSMMRR